MHLFGVDLVTDRLRDAHAATRGINARVGYAAADACRLPFAADSFDSTYCVAVLQHIRDLSGALERDSPRDPAWRPHPRRRTR